MIFYFFKFLLPKSQRPPVLNFQRSTINFQLSTLNLYGWYFDSEGGT